MEPTARHILLELYSCPAALLNDVAYVEQSLVAAARAADAEVLNSSFHRFSPQGVTGVVVIAESHISVHCWPEHGYAAVDIFTCGSRVDPDAAVRSLQQSLRCGSHARRDFTRGLLEIREIVAAQP